MLLRFIRVAECVRGSFLSMAEAVVWKRARSVHPFTRWRTYGLFPVWSYDKYSFYEHPCTTLSMDTLSLLLVKYLDGEQLDHMVGSCLTLGDAAKVFSKVISHRHVRALIALCLSEYLILSRHIYLIVAILVGVWWHCSFNLYFHND